MVIVIESRICLYLKKPKALKLLFFNFVYIRMLYEEMIVRCFTRCSSFINKQCKRWLFNVTRFPLTFVLLKTKLNNFRRNCLYCKPMWEGNGNFKHNLFNLWLHLNKLNWYYTFESFFVICMSYSWLFLLLSGGKKKLHQRSKVIKLFFNFAMTITYWKLIY